MGESRTIYITEQDLDRLTRLIEAQPMRDAPPNLDALEDELASAEVVAATEIPATVVTMNSRVRFEDVATRKVSEVELVYPNAADANQGRVSILAPVGSALIGLSVGQEIEWPAPGGTRRLKILEVLYQPEAAGDFTL